MAGPYWCWLCQRERKDCGGTDGSCPAVEQQAAEYREELAAGKHRTMFKTRRLASEREYGMSQREIAKETVESAKAEGREIASVKEYGDVSGPKRNAPDLSDLRGRL